MLSNSQISETGSLLKDLHTIISITFLIIALWLLVRTTRGFWRNLKFKYIDTLLSYAFIIALYLQLIFGLFLFASPNPADHYTNLGGELNMAAHRFWPVEHIVFMLFALFIANIGLIFSNQAKESREKHRKILVYYSISVLMISISLIMVQFR